MVEIVSLKKSYGTKVVLSIDNFTFEEGKKYALIGANGSGKSTLLKLIDQYESFDNGEIIIDKDCKVGYMPQNSYPFKLSLKANISLSIPCTFTKDNSYKYYKERVKYLIDKLDLSKLSKKNASKLSGGETQRMALARTLVDHHDILLLDEPTSAMDLNATTLAEDALREYYIENYPTIIFATHSLNQAERLADYVLFFKDGNIVEVSPAKEFISNPKTQELKEFLKHN